MLNYRSTASRGCLAARARGHLLRMERHTRMNDNAARYVLLFSLGVVTKRRLQTPGCKPSYNKAHCATVRVPYVLKPSVRLGIESVKPRERN